jgi:protein SHQ1
LVASYRRSLAFPLYRSFALSEKCRLDVASLLSKGKRITFRCLLEMKDILDHHEVYYIYSKIWVDDFCVWLQAHAMSEILLDLRACSDFFHHNHSDDVLFRLGTLVKDTLVPKSAIGWDLEQLEAVVQQAQNDNDEREPDSDDESEEENLEETPASL